MFQQWRDTYIQKIDETIELLRHGTFEDGRTVTLRMNEDTRDLIVMGLQAVKMVAEAQTDPEGLPGIQGEPGVGAGTYFDGIPYTSPEQKNEEED